MLRIPLMYHNIEKTIRKLKIIFSQQVLLFGDALAFGPLRWIEGL